MKSEDINALIVYRMEQAQTALGDAETLLNAHRSTTGVVNRSYYAAFYAGLACF